MGRFKHEGANVIVNHDGHVVAYMGDDERFDYVYRFVSRDKYRRGDSAAVRRHNRSLLSQGDLSVARFTGDGLEDGISDGTGEWLPLTRNGRSMVPGFTLDEVLVYTRLAADAVQPTKMDRPEDVEPSLHTGKIYVACTNNTDRGADGKEGRDRAEPAQLQQGRPRRRISPRNGDHTASRFHWNLILICGDPDTAGTYFGGYDGPVSPIACPDNVAFDSVGNLWISTDGSRVVTLCADGLFKVPVAGPERGRVQQFLAVPVGAETCGPVIHDKESSVFVAVQHPGEGSSFAAPTSRFPDFVPAGAPAAPGEFAGPRPSVVQVRRRRRPIRWLDGAVPSVGTARRVALAGEPAALRRRNGDLLVSALVVRGVSTVPASAALRGARDEGGGDRDDPGGDQQRAGDAVDERLLGGRDEVLSGRSELSDLRGLGEGDGVLGALGDSGWESVHGVAMPSRYCWLRTLPRMAMPRALPSSRAVSLTAEATPCSLSGSDSVMAVVAGVPASAIPAANSTRPRAKPAVREVVSTWETTTSRRP